MPRIMVVDDQVECRRPLDLLLQMSGYQTCVAGDGRAALELLDDCRPDLVLLDLMMPVMDGFGFLEGLRRRSAWSALPVVVFSAREDEGQSDRRLAELGVETVLRKGDVGFDEILSVVEGRLKPS